MNELPVDIQLKFFLYLGASFVLCIRLISFNFYKKNLLFWGILALIAGILAFVFIPIVPNYLSLCLLSPLLSITLMELSDHLYTKTPVRLCLKLMNTPLIQKRILFGWGYMKAQYSPSPH